VGPPFPKRRSQRDTPYRFWTSQRGVLHLEHDFVGEEGGPLKGGGSIIVRTANEFVLAVGEFDEFGVTKLPN